MKLNRDILRNLPLALRIEIEENLQRKPLTQSELAAQQKRILDELRKHKAPGTRTDLKGRTPEKVFSEVHATGIVGKLFNESHKQIEKRLAVVAAAAADPARFGKLLEDLDRSNRVNGPYKRLQVARAAAQIKAEPPPLPGNCPYRVIVADPPWPYDIDSVEPSHRATYPYPQMSIAQICAVDVDSIAATDAVLWLWTTNFHLRKAFDVLDAWGFASKTALTWAKDRMGNGHWLRGQTEHCLLATRGKPVVTLKNESTLLLAPVRDHSRKPDEFYQLVERLCPAARYCELFARSARPHWDGHGNEAPGARPVGAALDLVAANKVGSHG
jgi:N6-adenosine-specific RNA methylase IME4